MSLLNRELVNQNWINFYPTTYARYLPASISDHLPILVHLQKLPSQGPKPFRYLHRWSSKEGFLDIVKEGRV